MTDAALLSQLLGDTSGYVVDRAMPVPGDLRSEWRVALVLLLLGKCHGGSATLEQLHVLNSAALFEDSARMLARLVSDDARHTAADRPLIRYEPALSRAVDLSVGVELTEWSESGRLRLTTAGREAHTRLASNSAILAGEKDLLAQIPGRVSQAALDRLLAQRS